MTTKQKKAFLRQYSTIDKNITRLCEELSVWRSRATKVTSTTSDMPRVNGEKNGFAEAIERIVEVEEKINAEIDRLVLLREQIEKAIKTIDDETLRLLMHYRYIDCLTWERIAIDMNYSYMHITRLHGKALLEMML